MFRMLRLPVPNDLPSERYQGNYGVLVVQDAHEPNAYQFKLIDRQDVEIFHIEEEFYSRLYKVFTFAAQEVMNSEMSEFTFRQVLTRVKELMTQHCPNEFNGVVRGEKITYRDRPELQETVITPITI